VRSTSLVVVLMGVMVAEVGMSYLGLEQP